MNQIGRNRDAAGRFTRAARNQGRVLDQGYDQDYARLHDGYGRWRKDDPQQQRSASRQDAESARLGSRHRRG